MVAITVKIDAKFEEKLTCAFKNEMRNLTNFHRLKNSDFILESKMVKLNRNKNLKELDWPDAVKRIILPFISPKIILNFLYIFCKIFVFKA